VSGDNNLIRIVFILEESDQGKWRE
jgi:hypothetical protein